MRLPRLSARPLALALLASSLTWAAPTAAASAASRAGPAASEFDREAAIARFRELFAELRAGRDVDRDQLAALATDLAAHGRPDALDLVRFYGALDPEQRRAGQAAHERYVALWRQVAAARRERLTGAAWSAERERIEADLRALGAEFERAPDPAPAAYAHALLAELAIAEVANNRALAPDTALARVAAAEHSLARARELFERVGMRTPLVEVIATEGRIALFQDELGRAEERFERARAIAAAVDLPGEERVALAGLMDVAEALGDVARQEDLLVRIAALSPPEESFAVARQCALLLWNQDQPMAALEVLERYPPDDDDVLADIADYELLCGMIARRLGDLGAARAHQSELERLGSPALATRTTLAAARLALAESDPARALQLVRNAVAERPAEVLEACAIEAEAALALDDPAHALQALEPAFALADTTDRARAFEALEADLVRDVLGEELGLSTVALGAEAHLRLGAPLEALRLVLDLQARTLREGGLATRSPAERLRAQLGGGPLARIEVADVVAWAAGSDLGLVAWVVGADLSVVLWARPDGSAEGERLAIGRSAMRRAARRLREAIASSDDERADRLGFEILATLWPQGLRDALARVPSGAPPRTLDLILPGPLAELPFEACPIADPELAAPGALRRVDELALVRTLPGLPAKRRGQPTSDLHARPWFFGGAPLADTTPTESAALDGQRAIEAASEPALHEPLAGARRELREAAARRPGSELAIGDAFDRPTLERALQQGLHLHLATHLVPSASCHGRRFAREGFALAQGEVFCPEDVVRAAPAIELAILSACGTAGGRFVDADGLRGPTRAFLEAGTRDVVVTLWAVEDAAAERFGRAFHAAFASGAAPSAAALAGRTALRTAGRPARDWAAFRFVGRD